MNNTTSYINSQTYSQPPKSEEFEFSILGGGKAYGECLVLHLGNGKWGIIDNCVEQKSRKPLPLQYLEKIQVSSDNVDFILCTHWHQDHITNITSIFKKCKNAKFYISAALNCEEFRHFLGFKERIQSAFNPAREFKKLMAYVHSSKRKLTRVNQDKLIYSHFVEGNLLLIKLYYFMLFYSSLSLGVSV